MFKAIAVFVTILLSLLDSGTAAAQSRLWEDYKKQFLSGDGRIIDHFQHSNSHSEGQGYGLLLSVLHGDRGAFDRILEWTESNLQVRRDALSAWSWGKRPNGRWKIIDYNNATDGDLLLAWALLKAYRAWQHSPYREKALDIIGDIREELAREKDGLLVLAPAYFGFERGDGLVVNNGYMVFSAFTEFAAAEERQFWLRVRRDSLRLLGKSRFSRFRLPADWVKLEGGGVSIDSSRSPFFGYEAIRIPLYLAMAGENDRLQSFSEYLKFVAELGYLPNRFNLVDGTISADRAPAGFHAVFGRCAARLGQEELARRLMDTAADRIRNESRDYFSYTLYLLSKASF
jgi:endoglucanase